MKFYLSCVFAITMGTIGATAIADAPVRPYILEGTQVHSIPSKILQRDYEIFVSLPESYATGKKSYPVLFVTDANYVFPVLRSINRRVSDNGERMEEFILIALSYAKGDSPTVSRNRDYTPTDIDAKKTRESDQSGEKYGGGDDYRRYVVEEVFPFVAKHFRADMNRKVFMGHSYGALFGMLALFREPTTFSHYVLSSPSLWFDKYTMLDVERQYAAKHKDLRANDLLLAGAFEALRPDSRNKRYSTRVDMVRDMKKFETQLKARRNPGLAIHAEVIQDEDHLTVAPAAITRGLMWAFGKPDKL